MNTYSNYIAYFENLVKQSVHFDHDPLNNKKAFYRINIEEVLNGIRTEIENDSYFFILTNYTYKPIDSGNQHLKEIQLMFFVMGKHRANDFDHETEVLNKCEEITDKFLNRIRKDSTEETLDENSLFFSSQNRLTVDNVAPVTLGIASAQVGWQTVLKIAPFWNNCVDASDWDDLT